MTRRNQTLLLSLLIGGVLFALSVAALVGIVLFRDWGSPPQAVERAVLRAADFQPVVSRTLDGGFTWSGCGMDGTCTASFEVEENGFDIGSEVFPADVHAVANGIATHPKLQAQSWVYGWTLHCTPYPELSSGAVRCSATEGDRFRGDGVTAVVGPWVVMSHIQDPKLEGLIDWVGLYAGRLEDLVSTPLGPDRAPTRGLR